MIKTYFIGRANRSVAAKAEVVEAEVVEAEVEELKLHSSKKGSPKGFSFQKENPFWFQVSLSSSM